VLPSVGPEVKQLASAIDQRQPRREWESTVIIRNENESDIEAIAEVTKTAFATCPYGEHTEQFIINALRAAGALPVSLVAQIDENVVGHVAFSPVTISDGSPDWYGLGPVSVLPPTSEAGHRHRPHPRRALAAEGSRRQRVRSGG